MAKKLKIIKSEDDDLYEGLPLPEHIDKANDIPEKDIYFKKKVKVKTNKSKNNESKRNSKSSS